MLVTGQRSHAGVEETRGRIIAAARVLFERNGTRGTTTREVAERAGVNEATLFRHFGSKRVLLDAMREASCDVDEFRAVVDTLTGADLNADLHRIADFTIGRMVAKRSMMCISLAEEAAGTDDAPEWRGPSQLVVDLSGYFARQISAGRMRGEPMFLARAFMGLFFSTVVGRKLWQTQHPDGQTIDAIVNLFLNGAKV